MSPVHRSRRRRLAGMTPPSPRTHGEACNIWDGWLTRNTTRSTRHSAIPQAIAPPCSVIGNAAATRREGACRPRHAESRSCRRPDFPPAYQRQGGHVIAAGTCAIRSRAGTTMKSGQRHVFPFTPPLKTATQGLSRLSGPTISAAASTTAALAAVADRRTTADISAEANVSNLQCNDNKSLFS